MPILHMEFDWAVKKKNVRQCIWSCLAIIFTIIEIEQAWDPKKAVFAQSDTCEALKCVISFITVMQLYYLYDYYDYLVAGAKKEWYKMLYAGENPGPVPSFSMFMTPFICEFIILCLHCPPYFDFRFWKTTVGQV